MSDAVLELEVDGADSGAEAAVRKVLSAINELSGKTTALGATAQEVTDKISGGFDKVLSSMRQIVATVATVAGLSFGFGAWIKEGIDFDRKLEVSRIGIAAMVQTFHTLHDSQGELITGAKAYAAALDIATDAQDRLRAAAFQTNATFSQLEQGYERILAGVGNQKASTEEIVRLTQTVANLASTMQVPFEAAFRQIQLALEGFPRASGQIGAFIKAMGIDGATIRSWREQGDAVQNLQGKLDQFLQMGPRLQATFTGLVSQVKDAIEQIAGRSMQPVVDSIKRQLATVMSSVATIGGQSVSFNPAVLEPLKEVGTIIASVVQKMAPLAAAFFNLGVAIAKAGASFLDSLGPAIPLITAVINGTTNLIDALGPMGPAIVAGFYAFNALSGVVATIASVTKALGAMEIAIGGVTMSAAPLIAVYVGISAIVAGLILAIPLLQKFNAEAEAKQSWDEYGLVLERFKNQITQKTGASLTDEATEKLLSMTMAKRTEVMQALLEKMSAADGKTRAHVITLQELNAMTLAVTQSTKDNTEATDKQMAAMARIEEKTLSLRAKIAGYSGDLSGKVLQAQLQNQSQIVKEVEELHKLGDQYDYVNGKVLKTVKDPNGGVSRIDVNTIKEYDEWGNKIRSVGDDAAIAQGKVIALQQTASKMEVSKIWKDQADKVQKANDELTEYLQKQNDLARIAPNTETGLAKAIDEINLKYAKLNEALDQRLIKEAKVGKISEQAAALAESDRALWKNNAAAEALEAQTLALDKMNKGLEEMRDKNALTIQEQIAGEAKLAEARIDASVKRLTLETTTTQEIMKMSDDEVAHMVTIWQAGEDEKARITELSTQKIRLSWAGMRNDWGAIQADINKRVSEGLITNNEGLNEMGQTMERWGRDAATGITAGIKQAMASIPTEAQSAATQTKAIFADLGAGFQDLFVNVATKGIHGFADAWDNFRQTMVKEWAKSMSDMLMRWIKNLTDMGNAKDASKLGGSFGGTYVGGAAQDDLVQGQPWMGNTPGAGGGGGAGSNFGGGPVGGGLQGAGYGSAVGGMSGAPGFSGGAVVGGVLGGIAAGAGLGASMGSIGGPIVALIGAIIGGIVGVLMAPNTEKHVLGQFNAMVAGNTPVGPATLPYIPGAPGGPGTPGGGAIGGPTDIFDPNAPVALPGPHDIPTDYSRYAPANATDIAGKKVLDEMLGSLTDIFRMAAPDSAHALTESYQKNLANMLVGGRFDIGAGSNEDIQKDWQTFLTTTLPKFSLQAAFGQVGYTSPGNRDAPGSGKYTPGTPGTAGQQTTPGGIAGFNFWLPGMDQAGNWPDAVKKLYDPDAPIPKMLKGLGFTADTIKSLSQELVNADPKQFMASLNSLVSIVVSMRDLGKELAKTRTDLYNDMTTDATRSPASRFQENADAIVGRLNDLSLYSGDELIKQTQAVVDQIKQRYDLELQYITKIKGIMDSLDASLTQQAETIRTAFQTQADVNAKNQTIVTGARERIHVATTPEEVQQIAQQAQGAIDALFKDLLNQIQIANQVVASVDAARETMRQSMLTQDQVTEEARDTLAGVFDQIANAADASGVQKAADAGIAAIKTLFDGLSAQVKAGQDELAIINDQAGQFRGMFSGSPDLHAWVTPGAGQGVTSANANPFADFATQATVLQAKLSAAAQLSGMAQVKAIQDVGAAAKTMYDQQRALLQQIVQQAQDLHTSIAQQRREMQLAQMDPGQQADFLHAEIDRLGKELEGVTDPARIKQITDAQQGDITQYLGLFKEGDSNRQAAYAWADKVLAETDRVGTLAYAVMTDKMKAANDQMAGILEAAGTLLQTNITDATTEIGMLDAALLQIRESVTTNLGSSIDLAKLKLDQLAASADALKVSVDTKLNSFVDEILATNGPLGQAMTDAMKLFTDSGTAVYNSVSGEDGLVASHAAATAAAYNLANALNAAAAAAGGAPAPTATPGTGPAIPPAGNPARTPDGYSAARINRANPGLLDNRYTGTGS
ncbi:MAG: hypothetical protein EPN91_02445 [Salinibacterium sp.]|nr:MAG: hypothetical protein EPN91_02445 [Salinibacterium sp.]